MACGTVGDGLVLWHELAAGGEVMSVKNSLEQRPAEARRLRILAVRKSDVCMVGDFADADTGEALTCDSFSTPFFFGCDTAGQKAVKAHLSLLVPKEREKMHQIAQAMAKEVAAGKRHSPTANSRPGGLRSPERRDEVVAAVKAARSIREAMLVLKTSDHRFIRAVWGELGKPVVDPRSAGGWNGCAIPAKTTERIIGARQRGNTVAAIATELNIKQMAVRYVLKKAGIAAAG